VKVFDLVVGRTGIRDDEATAVASAPRTVSAAADEHTAYYPGAQPTEMRWTADVRTGRLLGAQAWQQTR
jgi:hypothetical protein